MIPGPVLLAAGAFAAEVTEGLVLSRLVIERGPDDWSIDVLADGARFLVRVTDDGVRASGTVAA